MDSLETSSHHPSELSDRSAKQRVMPAVLDLENSILVLLTMLANMISTTGQATFRGRHGLGSTEWKVLSTVAGQPQSSGARIAEFLSIDRGLVSRTIQALSRKNYVCVEKTGRQSNYQAVSLTSEGERIHSEALKTAIEREKTILADIDIDDRDAMIKSLKKMLINMKAVAALSAQASPNFIDLEGLEHLR
jgi:DNA-binding MarR family transcriptional regulator